MKATNYNSKLGNLSLASFKKYVEKHHKEDLPEAEKIHKELAELAKKAKKK